MPDLSNPRQIKEILARHGFTFSKGLGQNFIINPSVCPKIAQLGGAEPDTGVLEIGPGIGVLTAELARRAQKVVSIEIDERLRPVLNETLAEYANITVLFADALQADLHQIIKTHFADMAVRVCANLPYYITSPLLMHLLESCLPVQSITVMVQKEAAARICAAPGSKNAGAISAAVSYYSNAEILFSVSKGSFLPAPKVDSSVIRLKVLKSPSVTVQNEKLFFALIKAGFAQRRKTLLNSLSSGLSVSKETLLQIFHDCAINPSARAQELSLEDFRLLADAADKII